MIMKCMSEIQSYSTVNLPVQKPQSALTISCGDLKRKSTMHFPASPPVSLGHLSSFLRSMDDFCGDGDCPSRRHKVNYRENSI